MKRKSLKDMPIIVYISLACVAVATVARAIYRKVKDY